MKISTLLTGFLLAGLITRAQPKTIEVTVTDTVYAKATEFLYVIKVIDVYNDAFDTPDTSNTLSSYIARKTSLNLRQKRVEDSLSTLLKAKGFAVMPTSVEAKFIQYYEETGFELYIQTHSLDSVQMLYDVIKDKPTFIGYIGSRKAGDEADSEKKVIAKVLANATVKASVIAEAGKLKLGSIISVKEVEKEGGWVAYPPLSASSVLPGWHTTIGYKGKAANAKSVTEDYYPISATLTVTFAAQ